jgi:hypothetical protein
MSANVSNAPVRVSGSGPTKRISAAVTPVRVSKSGTSMKNPTQSLRGLRVSSPKKGKK